MARGAKKTAKKTIKTKMSEVFRRDRLMGWARFSFLSGSGGFFRSLRRALFYAGIVFLALIGAAALLTLRLDIPAARIDAKYANADSQFLILPNGARAHIRDQGKRDAPALLLLHGSNGSLHSWEGWARALGDSYRVITIDLPGHGLTGRVPNDDYSQEAFVDFVDQLAGRLSLRRFYLGGNSMGGETAWRYALLHPRKVKALILVAAGGYRRDEGAEDRGPLIFRLLSYAPMRRLFQYISARRFTEEGVRNAYADSPVVTEALVDRYHELNLREGTRRATALRFADQGERRLPPPPNGRITVPTLVMWGKKDSLIPHAVVKKFLRDLPNAVSVVYEDLGHLPMEEDPDRTARDVRAFLGALLRP